MTPLNILLVTVAWPLSGDHNIYTDLMAEFRDNGHRVDSSLRTGAAT